MDFIDQLREKHEKVLAMYQTAHEYYNDLRGIPGHPDTAEARLDMTNLRVCEESLRRALDAYACYLDKV